MNSQWLPSGPFPGRIPPAIGDAVALDHSVALGNREPAVQGLFAQPAICLRSARSSSMIPLKLGRVVTRST